MANGHALLGPSGAERWLNCTPSARLEAQFPDKSGRAADEGTLAHALGELQIRKYVSHQLTNMPTLSQKEYKARLAEIMANELYAPEMLEHADNYCVHILEKFAEAQTRSKDAMLFLEQKLDLSKYIPEGFGTGDSIIIADSVMDFDDLKYGKGVPVSAERNKQLMLYALGALEAFEFLFDIKSVRMTIYQPRLDSVTTYEMTVPELKAWANDELVPRAALAFEGLGEFAPGKHCRFCKARASCRANADYHLELAKHDFKVGALLEDHEIAKILDRKDMFEKWLTGVADYALHEAVINGKEWPGYKVVEGKSNRKYKDEATVAKALTEDGWKPEQFYNQKLLGLGDMSALLTKPVFETIVGPYIIKPAGKPTLAPVTDKRPAWDKLAGAIDDFADVEIDL